MALVRPSLLKSETSAEFVAEGEFKGLEVDLGIGVEADGLMVTSACPKESAGLFSVRFRTFILVVCLLKVIWVVADEEAGLASKISVAITPVPEAAGVVSVPREIEA